MRAPTVVDAARALGIVHVRDLAASGITERAVAARIRRGVWWRPLPRVVVLSASRHLTTEQRRLACLLWLPPCAVLSHADAATIWGLRETSGVEVHASVERGHTPRQQAGYVVHRIESLPTADRTRRAGLPVTTLERTLVDLHDLLDRSADRRALIAAAFQQRRTTAAKLLGVAARVPKLHQREDLVEHVLLAADGAHSTGEMDVFEWLVAAGFPRPERQFPVRVAGRVRYLDAADPILRIAYETDGLHHGDLAQRDADNERDLELAAEWWETVRLTTFRVRQEPGRLRDAVARLREQRQALADAGLLHPARRADVA